MVLTSIVVIETELFIHLKCQEHSYVAFTRMFYNFIKIFFYTHKYSVLKLQCNMLHEKAFPMFHKMLLKNK